MEATKRTYRLYASHLDSMIKHEKNMDLQSGLVDDVLRLDLELVPKLQEYVGEAKEASEIMGNDNLNTSQIPDIVKDLEKMLRDMDMKQLKDGVEKTLMEQLPQLQGVRDMTDHSDRSNAYY